MLKELALSGTLISRWPSASIRTQWMTRGAGVAHGVMEVRAASQALTVELWSNARIAVKASGTIATIGAVDIAVVANAREQHSVERTGADAACAIADILAAYALR